MIKKINVKTLCKDNKLRIINKNQIKKFSYVYRPAINRAGLELKGFAIASDIKKNIIGWGTTESNFMDTLDLKDLEQILDTIFHFKPPLIICSVGVNKKNKQTILKIASNNNIPVVFPELHLSDVATTLGVYLASIFAQDIQVHASLIIINGIGVLVIGDSGIGKSEAILDLIQKNHIFVSDDAVIVKKIGLLFYGQSPEITKDILEARGIGLIDIRKIYGEKSIKTSSTIDLVVKLTQYHEGTEFDRLGNFNSSYRILGSKIPMIQIPVRSGRSISSLIEAAVNVHIAKQNNIDALETILNRTNSLTKK